MAIWPAKKGQPEEPPRADTPEANRPAAENEADLLAELVGQLGRLGQSLDQLQGRIVEYLARRPTPAAADREVIAALMERIEAIGEQFDRLLPPTPAVEPAPEAAGEETLRGLVSPILERLDRLESDCKSIASRPAGDVPDDTVASSLREIRDAIQEQLVALADGMRHLEEQLARGLQGLEEKLRGEEQEQAASGASPGSDWQRAILGPRLADYAGLDFQRQRLLNGVLEGNRDACSLVGQLLAFRAAPAERMPPLLKELGEAYYRWQPKTGPGSDKMEQALIACLQATMQEAGMANTIEVVHPGQRFDAARHKASAPGVEITGVHGWIVLRDNGKVYTKAAVSVK